MKEYNKKKWWIDSDYVREMRIEADNVLSAVKKYRENVEENYYIGISDNAIKTKEPMYIDVENEPVQCGYIITAYTYFDNNVKQFIDLWVEINTLNNPFIA